MYVNKGYSGMAKFDRLLQPYSTSGLWIFVPPEGVRIFVANSIGKMMNAAFHNFLYVLDHLAVDVYEPFIEIQISNVLWNICDYKGN